ncbi:MAG: ATP-binding domain-containing protein [Planctomycetaceae bacterium]
MHLVPSERLVTSDPRARHLVDNLATIFQDRDTKDFFLYHSFPLYKDADGNSVLADALFVSPHHGVIAFALPAGVAHLSETMGHFEQVPAHIYSRLIRTKSLRTGLSTLILDVNAVIALFDGSNAECEYQDIPVVTDTATLREFLSSCQRPAPLEYSIFQELLATLDGAKGLIRPVTRKNPDAGHKAKVAYLVETAINDFDVHQKHGMYGAITGPTRIRGIAGSGKTVVLAMKAALLHLANPDSHVLYTFYTKSLYQHVRRLITRFYRQFDDRDPDWNKIHIMHGWGGKATPGVYFDAAMRLGITPLTYQSARVPAALEKCDPFDFACRQVEQHASCAPVYDFVLVDEAQDFPASFLRLCHRLAHASRFVFAYDELQNIFQPSAPTIESTFGPSFELADDVILRVCYRNPKEVLICSHAMGFGFYGKKIVQILEGSEHWESLGYNVVSGQFAEGESVVIERPDETSLTIVSENDDMNAIVSATAFDNDGQETAAVAQWIIGDVTEGGLSPEDIMVISVDDRHARVYLQAIQRLLVRSNIPVNNIHEDVGGMKEFWIPGHVTLTTVHKAKGNEAFAVYVVGADAPMDTPGVRNRNMLFTAMTRAKAWLKMSGVGDAAKQLVKEIEEAKKRCPRMEFMHPSSAEIELIRRDIAESADRRTRLQRVLSELAEFTDEIDADEVMAILRMGRSTRRHRNSEGRKSKDG